MKHYLLAIVLSLTLSGTQATNPSMWQRRYHHYYPQLGPGNNVIYEKKYLDPRSVGESSLRDLDIGVGIGVEDNAEGVNPITPESLQQQYVPVMIQEPSLSSKEVNIGLYTGPENDIPVLYNPQPQNPQLYNPRIPSATYFNPIQPQHNLFDATSVSLPYPYSNGVQYPLPFPQRTFSYQQIPPLLQILKGSSTVQNTRSYEKPFDGYERFRDGTYAKGYEPLFMNGYEQNLPRRMGNHVKQVIVNEEGAPVMVAEPYGNRRVGAFKLLNDQGYHVTMNVPPNPTGVADGVLVMEMKATLYRPVN